MTARPRVLLFTLAALVVLTMSLIGAPHASASSFSDRIIELTNAERHAIRGPGCPALTANRALAIAAQRHAADMATRNYFSHRSRRGATAWQRASAAGYRARRIAENIAAGQPTPEAVVAGWMSSPGHRANILHCGLREIGIGRAHGARSTYGTYWVQLFAARR